MCPWWKVWQAGAHKQEIPTEKLPVSETELNARSEIHLPPKELDELHAAVESTGRGRDFQLAMWASAKLSTRTVRQPAGEKTTRLLSPGPPPISYPAATLELLYLVSKEDATPNKKELGAMVEQLGTLSAVERITDQKTGNAALRNLKTFIDKQREKRMNPEKA